MASRPIQFENRLRWELPDGRLHREDGPAIIWKNGSKAWYINGKLHREDGPAVIYADGTTKWYRHGDPHREDGPAVIWIDGTTKWYRHGEMHREDGPAVIRPDGGQEWWVNGFNITNKIEEWAKEMNVDLDNLTDEDKFLIKLYWENYSK